MSNMKSLTYQSKDIANVKVFADKQTDEWTSRQAKNYTKGKKNKNTTLD